MLSEYFRSPEHTATLGFDVSNLASSRDRLSEVLGHGAANLTESPEPIFTIAKVQYALSDSLTHLCCSNNTLLLGVQTRQGPRLICIHLDRPDQENLIEIPNQNSTVPSRIHKLFFDPSGKHVVISLSSSDCCYVYLNWPKDAATGCRTAKVLNRFKGILVESLAWPSSLYSEKSATSTREILVGTSEGKIYESCLDGELESSFRPIGRTSHDRYMRPVVTLPEREAVKGLFFHSWQLRKDGSNKKRVAIIASTVSSLFQYVCQAGADDNVFEPLATVYKENSPKAMDLPSEAGDSSIDVHRTRNEQGVFWPVALAWLTNHGIYHGRLLFASQEAGDGVVDSSNLVPFPTREGETRPPRTVKLSAYHFVLLYQQHIHIVRMLDDQTVFCEKTEAQSKETILNIASDVLKQTCWVYTERTIFELGMQAEDRDIWRVYLDKSMFDLALRHAKHPQQQEEVLLAKADSLYAHGRYMQAAELYAKTGCSFEEVVLKFVEKNERDALRNYLSARLERLPRKEIVQRMMLATWLFENFLFKLNQLEDAMFSEPDADLVGSFRLEKTIVESDLRDFLAKYKDSLDKQTVYDTASSHGRNDFLLAFAQLVEDFEAMLDFYVQEQDWSKAVECLDRCRDASLYYKHSHILLCQHTSAAIQCFQRRDGLDLQQLLPSILSSASVDNNIVRELCAYLQQELHERGNQDTLLHNSLVALYASSKIEERHLLHFLSNARRDPATGEAFYDAKYALRVCQQNKRVEACVQLFVEMQMFDSAVELALRIGDMELAKLSVDRVEIDNSVLRRKLWLDIAKHVVQTHKDIKTAMKYLEGSDILKVEDILPFFPDFIVIDDFKDEICTALESYSQEIDKLKEEMQEATDNAELIKQDIADLANRLIVIDAADKCTTCCMPLLSRQFYIFPCQHGFHADCLIYEITQYVSPAVLRRILNLQDQLSRLNTQVEGDKLAVDDGRGTFASMADVLGLKPIPRNKLTTASLQSMDQLRKLVIPDALVNVIGAGAEGLMAGVKLTGSKSQRPESQTRDFEKLAHLRNELDDILAASCVLCDRALSQLDRPFVGDGEEF